MNEIKKIILNSSLRIKSKSAIDTYITFCLDNDMGARHKQISALHHILPKALFPIFKNLKTFKWNGVHLSFYNHYYAHWLLTEAIDAYGVYYAFCAMHNKDHKLGRLAKTELVDKNTYKLIMESKSKAHKITLNKPRVIDGIVTSSAQQIGIKNKLHKEKEIILNDGSVSSVAKEEGKKHSKYLNEIIILDDGSESTRSIESGKKHSKYLNEIIILDDGSESTRGKERGKVRSKLLRSKGKHYNLFNIFSGLIKKSISRSELIKISAVLPTKSKDNYLGKHFQSKKSLNASHNLHLVGLYVEEVVLI